MIDQQTVDVLRGISTATLTTVLFKKGLRNVWLRGAKPIRAGAATYGWCGIHVAFCPRT